MREVIATTLPLEPICDQTGLPRVLLIGDSISIGYTMHVRTLLSGKANVHRPPTNCASTRKGLDQIEEWLGDGHWDVVCFNWGLHDLGYANIGQPTRGRSLVPIEEYDQNLRQLVSRLETTGAALIWQSTTPVPFDAEFCDAGAVNMYNQVAARVMHDHNIEINDLFDWASSRLAAVQRHRDVHFTYGGSKKLAEQVAGAITERLDSSVGDESE